MRSSQLIEIATTEPNSAGVMSSHAAITQAFVDTLTSTQRVLFEQVLLASRLNNKESTPNTAPTLAHPEASAIEITPSLENLK